MDKSRPTKHEVERAVDVLVRFGQLGTQPDPSAPTAKIRDDGNSPVEAGREAR